MQRVAVELGVHGDRGDAELAGGARDAHGDLAAVGDEDPLQHGRQCRVRAVPNTESGRCPESMGLQVALTAG